MKTIALSLSLAMLAGIASAQVIDPRTQINWGRVTGSGSPVSAGFASSCPAHLGQPYTDVTGPHYWQCGVGGWFQVDGAGSGPTVEYNGSTSNVLQNVIDFNTTDPAAPAGYLNCIMQNDPATGSKSCYVPSGGLIENLLNLPSAAQHVVIHPTCASYTGPGTGCAADNNPRTSSVTAAGASSGVISLTSQLSSFPNAQGTIAFTSAALPSFVIPANVTSVYAYSINSAKGNGSFSIMCGTDNITVSNAPVLTSLNGTTVSTVTCTAEISDSLASPQGGKYTVADVGFIVYYTGTAPPPDTSTIVQPPILYTNYNNQLSLDPNFPDHVNGVQTVASLATHSVLIEKGNFYPVTDSTNTSGLCNSGGGTNAVLCVSDGTNWNIYAGGGGGGGLSGQTAGYLPKATTATTSTGPSNIDDGITTAGHITNHEPTDVTDGTGNAGAITYVYGTAPGAASGGVKVQGPTSGTPYRITWPGVQPSGSNTYLSCTAADPSVCSWVAGGGSSFITSLTTTGSSGAATVSGGVLNIPVYSGGGGTAWSALTNPSGNLALTQGTNLSSFGYTAAGTSGSMQDIFEFNGNSSSAATLWGIAQPGVATSGLASLMTIPSSASQHQINSVWAQGLVQSTGTNYVPFYGWASSGINGANIWTSNFGCSDTASFSASCSGLELDSNSSNTASSFVALFIQGVKIAQPSSSNAIVIAGPTGNFWQSGLWIEPATITSNHRAIIIDRQAASGTSDSNYLAFFHNLSGTTSESDFYADSSGNLQLKPFSNVTVTPGLKISGITGLTQCLQVNTSGVVAGSGAVCGGGGSPAFSSITSGSNTSAAMTVGTGASLAPTGTGTITANGLTGSPAITVSSCSGCGGSGGAWTNITGSTQITASGCTQSSSTGGNCAVSGSSTTAVTLSVLPGTYNRIHVDIYGESTSGTNISTSLIVNSDSAAHYVFSGYFVANATVGGSATASSTSCPSLPLNSGTPGDMTLDLYGYADASFTHMMEIGWTNIASFSATTNNQHQSYGCAWNSTAAITSLTFTIGSNDFAAGTKFIVYGVN